MNAARAIAISALVFLTGFVAGCPAPGDGAEDDPVTFGTEPLQCLRWQTQCGDECVDRWTDVDNCGACGNVCASGELCSEGTCVSECPDRLVQCGEACVSLDHSEEHCGECGNRCVADGAEGYCSAQGCDDWICRPNRLDDDGNRADGCERSCSGARWRDGGRDIDIDVFDVRGTVTVGGELPEGREVAAVVFEPLDTDASVYVPVFPQDDYNYRINVFPGRYTVRMVDDDTCNPRYSSCPGYVLEELVEITEDTELNMNLDAEQPFPGPEVRVSGEIRLDGEQLADASVSQGRRVRINFASRFRHHQFFIGADGPAVFDESIPSGTYRVTVTGLDCEVMPCQQKVVDESMTITEDTTFDWDFETVELTGEVTVGGAELGDSGTGNARGRVELRSLDPGSAGSTSAALSASGPGTFSARAYPGSYDLVLRNQTDCPGDASEAIPCTQWTVAHGVELESDLERDIDIDVVTLEGEVTLNGGEMLDSPATRNRGQLTFSGVTNSYTINFGAAGPVEYGIKMYPGTYQALVSNGSGCDLSRPVIPCQIKQLEPLDIDESQQRDIDLQVATVEGELTVDGQQMPDIENQTRGSVSLVRTPTEASASSDLGRSGPARYSMRVFADEGYTLVLDGQCYGDAQQVLPCGRSTLVDGLDIRDARRIDRDLKPIRLSGVLSANGRELDELDGSAMLILENGATSIAVRLENELGARFDSLVFPGEYRVRYRHSRYNCFSGMPCGESVVMDRFSARAGSELDVDLDVVDLQGEITYRGLGSSRRAEGDLELRHDDERVRVPVTNGNYGPVQLLDLPYITEFEGGSCRQADDVPCMPYLVDGCE